MFHVEQTPEIQEQLRRYQEWLAGPGIERGLIGPREVDRIWDRHILNCAVVAWDARAIPRAAQVVDVGSGAGLPGVVWAICRPDLTVVLVESLLRRTTFLSEVISDLGLDGRVTVVRDRAESITGLAVDVATARAVAPLSRLLPWLAPLVRPGGQILALKGSSVAEEIAAAAGVSDRLGLCEAELEEYGAEVLDPPTRVVRYTKTGA